MLFHFIIRVLGKFIRPPKDSEAISIMERGLSRKYDMLSDLISTMENGKLKKF